MIHSYRCRHCGFTLNIISTEPVAMDFCPVCKGKTIDFNPPQLESPAPIPVTECLAPEAPLPLNPGAAPSVPWPVPRWDRRLIAVASLFLCVGLGVLALFAPRNDTGP